PGRGPSPSGRPSYVTLPQLRKRGCSPCSPASVRTSTDLPEPEGPSSAVTLPRGSVKSRSASTILAPNATPNPATARHSCALSIHPSLGSHQLPAQQYSIGKNPDSRDAPRRGKSKTAGLPDMAHKLTPTETTSDHT